MSKLFPKLSKSWEPSATPYNINITLNHLIPGVDNARYDVYLSPILYKAVNKFVYNLFVKHANASDYLLEKRKKTNILRSIDEFKRLCAEILTGAINKAKLDREIQINYLAQAAIAKMLMNDITTQYDKLIETYKDLIRKQETLERFTDAEIIKLKEELTATQKNKKPLIKNVALEIFQCFADVLTDNLTEIRVSNFGTDSILSDDIFTNPILYTNNSTDDFFMIQEYVLLGHRVEDPIQFDAVLEIIKSVYEKKLRKIIAKDQANVEEDDGNTKIESADDNDAEQMDIYDDGIIEDDLQEPDAMTNQHHAPVTNAADHYIMNVDNIDELFNCFKTEEQLRILKVENTDKTAIKDLTARLNEQKNLLNYIFTAFKKKGLIDGIVASFEMQPVYLDYCPPLFPHDILNFLTNPKERRNVSNKLQRLKSNAKGVSIKPLQQKINDIKKIKPNIKKVHLIKFLKAFASYYKDRQNFNLLKEAMDWINLVTEEKTINLSRLNHTLYEFLMTQEQVDEEKPVINHVIIKTDVRGSTDITHQISERGLNPAFYFSRNFFDPITDILAEYGATKVFIEGDAIILSILEKEGSPAGWYSVARACGLAINMLLITRRYNKKNKRARLPNLEQGIGICYHNRPPTYLLDGENKIMISPAINKADRLSGCSRRLRRLLSNNKGPFNLYVFQTAEQTDDTKTVDDRYYRFNVNGIELNRFGFKKLKEEIKLKKITCSIPELQEDEIKIYTGKFPTATGKYQRLVVREARIPEVNPDDLSILQMTPKTYYEVCTNSKLYEYVKTKTK